MGGRLFCTEKLNLLTKEVSIIPTLFAFWWGAFVFCLFFHYFSFDKREKKSGTLD